jgi:hypothetical protein
MNRLPLHGFFIALLVPGYHTTLQAAVLPEHEPFSLLIVADEVNPHRLSDAELTQPQDLQPALSAPDSGLNLASITTVDSQCADQALELLSSTDPPDVVLYFAHRHVKDCNGNSVQDSFTALLEQGLQSNMGLVVLHHGLYDDIYERGTKAGLLQLIGASAGGISWDTENGQRVINVARGHFVTSNGITYQGALALAGSASAPAGAYSWFLNKPDELYPEMNLLEAEGETRTTLFATDTGEVRTLGYELQRPGWQGRVLVYQPGEYQPNALDDRDGSNFQILVNMIYYAIHNK